MTAPQIERGGRCAEPFAHAALFVASTCGFSLSVATLHADLVKPSRRATQWVNVRASPGGSRKLDILKPGAALPLIGEGKSWHEVRLPDRFGEHTWFRPSKCYGRDQNGPNEISLECPFASREPIGTLGEPL